VLRNIQQPLMKDPLMILGHLQNSYLPPPKPASAEGAATPEGSAEVDEMAYLPYQ